MLYIYLTMHTKFGGDFASGSWNICSWKSPDFLCIFLYLLHTKIKMFLKFMKNIFSCFDFFYIWKKAILVLDLISMKCDKIWSMFEWVIHHNIKKNFTIFCHTYWLDHQCYDTEIFLKCSYAIKIIINNTSRCNL